MLAYSIKFYKLIALIVCIVYVFKKKNCDLYYEFFNIINDRVSGKVLQSVESVSEPVCFYFSFYLRALCCARVSVMSHDHKITRY